MTSLSVDLRARVGAGAAVRFVLPLAAAVAALAAGDRKSTRLNSSHSS